MEQAAKTRKTDDSLTRAAFSRSLMGRLSHLQWLYLRNARRFAQAWLGRDGIDSDAKAVARRLEENGLHIADAATVLGPQGRAALEAASKLTFDKLDAEAAQIRAIIESGGNSELSKDYMIHLVTPGAVIDADSPYLRLALDPKLLGIVASYFRMWPELHHIGAWLNFPTGAPPGFSQLWHRDPEDYKCLKVFIYLEDVGDRNGAFSYIPGTHPFGVDSGVMPRHEHRRRIMDDEMAAAIPPERWVRCTGPAHTMVIADTVGFHRGGYVEEGRRLLVTFTYTSGAPRKNRTLRISGMPSWATAPIQKSALENAIAGPAKR